MPSLRKLPIYAAFAALLAVPMTPPASAGIPVSIIANVQGAAEHVATIAQWTAQIKQATEAVNQAKQIFNQTKTVASFIANPKLSIASLNDLARMSDSLSAIAGENTSLGASLRLTGDAMSAGQDLFGAGGQFVDAVSNFDSSGNPRNVTQYQALAALSSLSRKTREQIDASIKRDDERLKSIDKALNTLQSNPDAGTADIATAQLRVAVAQAGTQAEFMRQQQMLWRQDQERKELAAQLAAKQVAGTQDALSAADKAAEAKRAKATDKAHADIQAAVADPSVSVPQDSSIRFWGPGK